MKTFLLKTIITLSLFFITSKTYTQSFKKFVEDTVGDFLDISKDVTIAPYELLITPGYFILTEGNFEGKIYKPYEDLLKSSSKKLDITIERIRTVQVELDRISFELSKELIGDSGRFVLSLTSISNRFYTELGLAATPATILICGFFIL